MRISAPPPPVGAKLAQTPVGARVNVASVRIMYYAHVRSTLEYGSVVRAGAAKSYLDRVERVQHQGRCHVKKSG